ncbi:GumC family protein [Chitinophagaceae bacterium MMS25-I14]
MSVQIQDTNNFFPAAKDEAGAFNIHRILMELRRNWILFLASVAVCVLIVFIYLRYTTPVYKVNATVLIKDDDKAGSMGQQGNLLQDLGLLAGKSNVDNEVEILKSRSLMEHTVTDMQLNVSYYSIGRIKSNELFYDVPFKVQFLSLYKDSVGNKAFNLKIESDNGRYTLSAFDKKWKLEPGKTISLPIGVMLFMPVGPGAAASGEYLVTVQSIDEAVSDYMNKFTAVTTNKQVSTIDLTLQDELPEKGEAILNRLVSLYVQDNVADKNRIADSSIKFIDERLQYVGTELTGIEKQIQDFKTVNKLADISEQSKQLISSTGDYIKMLTQAEVQLSIITSLSNYLHNNANDRNIIPSSLIVQNDMLSGIIEAYNGLQMQRERLLLTNTEASPMVQNLDKQISNLRTEMTNSMASVKRELEVTVQEYRKRSGGIDNQIAQVPAKERVFLEYSRQQSIKQELYVFLLTKREETALTKSSTMSNIRIIDPAKTESLPFKPKKPLILLSALLLGCMLPAGFLYVRNLLNVRVRSKEDITRLTTIPILGEVGHNEEQTAVVVNRNKRSHISEQFRALRTNIQFMLGSKDHKTILVTSSMSGEGKSFVSMNLASTFALLGKKVVLMELDLRKPKIAKSLSLERTVGFSTYAIGVSEFEEIIVPSGVQENLYVITSGPIPPNPAELITEQRVHELFQQLRENFDYIIIDSAPVGLVTDAWLLKGFADVTLYLLRQSVTFKEQVKVVEELHRGGKLSRAGLVVNDIDMHRGKGYGNYYGYGYGYGYNYYGDESYFEEGPGSKKKKRPASQAR